MPVPASPHCGPENGQQVIFKKKKKKKKKKSDQFYLEMQGQKLLIWSYQHIGSNKFTA